MDIPYFTENFLKAFYRKIKPSLSFECKDKEEFEKWKEKLILKVKELLGEFPSLAPLKPQLFSQEEKEKYIREKWVIQTEEDCFMPLYLLIPKGRKEGQKLPAILCCHGHGPYGKDPVAGVHFHHPERIRDIQRLNYNYGEQMAMRGYVTICPDWRSFGERIGYFNPYQGKDICNVHFLQHLLLGRTLFASNLFDGMRAIDFLLTREEVDKEKIGCMGLSFGGTMTLYLSLLDDRIKAADVSGFATTTWHWAIDRPNFCGSQLIPHLYRYADIGDIFCALAPKPLLIESGSTDTCFYFSHSLPVHEKVRKAYRIVGKEENLWIEAFEGEHSFSGKKAPEFFDRFLKNYPS